MIDIIAALRTLLLSNAPLVALVGDRVYGAPPGMPENEPTPPRRSIVLQPMPGGQLFDDSPRAEQPISTRCYGPDGEQSYAVYRALCGVFYGAQGSRGAHRVGTSLIYGVRLDPGATDLDSDGWPVTYAPLYARFSTLET